MPARCATLIRPPSPGSRPVWPTIHPHPPFIIPDDITGDEGKKQTTVEEVLASLDDMVGLGNLKATIRSIVGKAIIQRQRVERGLISPENDGIHIAITGNPGTGKTEVAKRLGRVFKAAGILPTDKVVVREKKHLLDSMANSAASNMDKAVDEAPRGILFIDEAYSLIPMDNPSDKSQDGTAAIESLMTRMVGDAGKFITVIAGYKEPNRRIHSQCKSGACKPLLRPHPHRGLFSHRA